MAPAAAGNRPCEESLTHRVNARGGQHALENDASGSGLCRRNSDGRCRHAEPFRFGTRANPDNNHNRCHTRHNGNKHDRNSIDDAATGEHRTVSGGIVAGVFVVPAIVAHNAGLPIHPADLPEYNADNFNHVADHQLYTGVPNIHDIPDNGCRQRQHLSLNSG
jgi:hypothetical protein